MPRPSVVYERSRIVSPCERVSQYDTPDMQETSPRNEYVIGSALRTLQVLLAFGAAPHRFSLSELVAATKLEKSSVYRSLKTLEAAGFLSQSDDGRFGLTRVVHLLSSAVTRERTASLVEIAAPVMDELAVVTGESVHLGALAGDQTVVLDRRESPAKVRLASVVLGQSVPLHAGAVPKAVLAYVSDDVRTRVLASLPTLPVYASRTARDAGALERELEQVRLLGYALSDGDFDEAARGVGAPIFDVSGEVVGGISVGGPSFRISDERLREFGTLVRDAAQRISDVLATNVDLHALPRALAPPR